MNALVLCPRPPPVYQDDYVSLYNCDCREFLAAMREQVDCIFTDLPYGIGLDYGHADTWRPDRQVFAALLGAATANGSLTMTVSNRHLDYWMTEATAAGWHYQHTSVYWNRCRAGGNCNGQFAYAWEPILHFYKGEPIRLVERMLSDVLAHNGLRETNHPAERDLGTWRGLLRLLPGDSIFDPFAGVGTTLRSAKDLRRRAIGCEVETAFCQMAARRLAQEVLAL